jgi:hypothetical protein
VVARGGVDAVIALGAVIRGSTPHFDYVAGEAAKGLPPARRPRRRAGGVRRAHHRHHRAGARARRHQGRQQGLRRGDGGDRDGAAVPRARRRRRERVADRPPGRARAGAAGAVRPRRRARSTASPPARSRAWASSSCRPIRPSASWPPGWSRWWSRTTGAAASIDAIVAGSRNWRLERMARVDRNILRLAVGELIHAPETPVRVVINEAVELAKRFGTAESSAFVNGVLDRIAPTWGGAPTASRRASPRRREAVAVAARSGQVGRAAPRGPDPAGVQRRATAARRRRPVRLAAVRAADPAVQGRAAGRHARRDR